MPYFIGAGTPEWDELPHPETLSETQQSEIERFNAPILSFTYVEPWQAGTTVLRFPDVPGAEPEIPPQPVYRPPPRRSFFARLFSRQPQTPQPPPEQFAENYRKRQEAVCAHSLWKISRMTAACRAAGVKRVFGRYDGGNDESFTHFQGVEMSDGRVIEADELGKMSPAVDYQALVDDAVSAFMGSYGAGEFFLYGAVVIDFDTCTLTDEKNEDVVFGKNAAWRI
jgi:hypothetical protein